jgi:hypothetical protein
VRVDRGRHTRVLCAERMCLLCMVPAVQQHVSISLLHSDVGMEKQAACGSAPIGHLLQLWLGGWSGHIVHSLLLCSRSCHTFGMQGCGVLLIDTWMTSPLHLYGHWICTAWLCTGCLVCVISSRSETCLSFFARVDVSSTGLYTIDQACMVACTAAHGLHPSLVCCSVVCIVLHPGCTVLLV